ncbi:hypothetical protein [Raoultibacter phocaeensis]|uniref:hypothetical protein n=1 Tax=Raoultibacter phocaeensis TaxID=2479841 RepID=UPI001118ACCA|nr:hypothetical protein [Raoultibacter phocaeensis]
MKKYTLTSYDPIELDLPKPQVPPSLVDAQIEKLLEPLAEYHEIAEDREVALGDHAVVTTVDACIDGNPASNFVLEHSLYHVGGGEMPRTFDEELLGMAAGETKDAEAKIKLPLSQDGEASLLTMKVTVEKILSCRIPELTDEFVKEHFSPATTIEEFRDGVAKQFGKPDMAKDDAQFPDLVLDELAKRLVEEPDPVDLLPGQPLEALKVTCAIDALAEHLDIELSDDEITAQMPGNDLEQRIKIRKQLEDQGLGDEAVVFARREAALSWLVNNSRVSYK